MQAFMRQDDLIGVAKFVNTCLQKINPSLEGQKCDQPGVARRDATRSDLNECPYELSHATSVHVYYV